MTPSDLANLRLRAMMETECSRGFLTHEVPQHLREGLREYIVRGRPTGGFLRAVLENDLVSTVTRADPLSHAGLQAVINFLLDVAPAPAWGSRAKVEAWIAEGERVNAAAVPPPPPEENWDA